MFVLGLILILIAVGLVLAALLGGADDSAAFDLGNLELTGLSVAVVFLVGALTLLMLVLGLGLLRVAARKAAARRRESKKLDKLSAQLEQREAELRRERGHDEHPSTTTTTDRGAEGTTADATPDRHQDGPEGGGGQHRRDRPEG